MTKQIKTIFLGTPYLAQVALEALIQDSRFQVDLVITQEDHSQGRYLKKQAPAVKILAQKYNYPILQVDKIKKASSKIKELQPDLIVVVAYGQIIPKEILEIPRLGIINLHASLLPKYRGASCLQGALLNGDSETGLSFMKMNEGLDTGDIIQQISFSLKGREKTPDLIEKMADLIKENLTQVLYSYAQGDLQPYPQDESRASYLPIIKKEEGRLDFKEKAEIIERKVRAYYPWPGSFAFLQKNKNDNQDGQEKIILKIIELEIDFFKTDLLEEIKKYSPGEIFLAQKSLWIKCADQAIKPKILQLAGKKALNNEDFLRGNAWVLGKILQ